MMMESNYHFNEEHEESEAKILSQFFTILSVLHIFPSDEKLAQFLTHGIQKITNDISVALCLHGTNKQAIGFKDFEICNKCRNISQSINNHAFFQCELSKQENFKVYHLESVNKFFGYLLVKIENNANYFIYDPIISNITNMVSLIIENREQKKEMEAMNKHLQIQTEYLGKEINERARVEKALRESEKRLALAIKGSNDAPWDWDLVKDHLYYSNQWWEQIGYEPGELKADSSLWEKLMHSDDHENALKVFRGALESKKNSYKVEFRLLHKDGHYVPVLSRGVISYNESGKPIRVSGTNMDLTERKIIEEELRKAKENAEIANQAKSVFLANMSHELRSPLNGILGYAELLKNYGSLTEKDKKDLNVIYESGEHLLLLINEILDLAKIEAGKISIEEVTFDLFRFLKKIELLFELRAKKKNIDFSIIKSDSLPQYIKSDESKLNQILTNLIGNAIKFTDQGYITVSVSLLNRDDYGIILLLQVEDSGRGIAKDEQHKLFEPFEQTQSGIESKQGTGLGLAITKEIVELMGGKIEVYSQQDKGSVFSFTIHAKRSDIDNTSKQYDRKITAFKSSTNQYRILIVDDKWSNRELLMRLLALHNFQVRGAENGLEALEATKEWEPQFIWMDLRMPVMNGYEACSKIREMSHLRQPMIAALTASVFDSEKTRVLASVFDDFLRKPYRQEEILEKLAYHLKLDCSYD